MSRDRIDAAHFSPDIQEFIRLLHIYDVKYLITGGEAVIYYGYARLTGDVDFFYDRREENVRNLFLALAEFWGGIIPGIKDAEELNEAGLILQFGRPPNRIDLINAISGVSFDEAWQTRVEITLTSDEGDAPLFYIGLEKLIENKQAAGRPKDLEDLAYLRRRAQDDGA